ncbi:MAG: hypothetical protein HQK55_15735 [Deltaproteobacteria bacterium]|nr:hypothetical protein [Deltaproteobacteria bacterium]
MAAKTGRSKDIVFTIENKGNDILNLTGSPQVQITGPQASEFIIIQQPPSHTIAAGSSTAFTICYVPSGKHSSTATATIMSDDDLKTNYLINLSGQMAVDLTPVMLLLLND